MNRRNLLKRIIAAPFALLFGAKAVGGLPTTGEAKGMYRKAKLYEHVGEMHRNLLPTAACFDSAGEDYLDCWFGGLDIVNANGQFAGCTFVDCTIQGDGIITGCRLVGTHVPRVAHQVTPQET